MEQIQQRFAEQQNRVVDLQQLLTEIRAQVRQQLEPRSEEPVDPVVAQQRFRYVQYLKMQAEHTRQALIQEEQRLELIREEMRQAHVKKRSLELLEEKQKAAYYKALEAHQMNELEDIVVARRHRSR